MEKQLPSFVRGLLLAIALATAWVPTKPALAADKITYAWPGVITQGIAPFAFAQDLGFFKDEGIDFEVITLQGSGVIIPQLLAGTIFSSYASPDLLVISRQPGKPDFDIRYVYNAVRNSIWEISVLADSPIKSVKDLKGKNIGVGALTFANVPMTRAILKQQSVDPNDVSFIAVGGGVPAFEALRTGKIDALNLFDVQDAQLELQGTKIRILQFPPQFRGVSSHGFPVTNTMIREHPDLIERFGRAATEGTVACEANLTGCLFAYWKMFPELKPATVDDKAIAGERSLIAIRVKNMNSFDPGEAHHYGAYKDKDWQTVIDSLRLGGQLGDSEIKLNSLYTNQFVEAYNRFDTAKVVQRANAYAIPAH